jgi:hypothetical protein
METPIKIVIIFGETFSLKPFGDNLRDACVDLMSIMKTPH